MPYNRTLFDYVPPYYDELLESHEILTAEDEEFARLYASIDDVLAQFRVSTATWGLREWERICDVPTDESKSIEERRSVIRSKLRGYGVVTIEHIKNVADSFYGGETEVTELYSTYTIVVKFTSNYGTPPNLNDVITALREIVPAHLALQFEFKYLLIRDIHEVKTLTEMESIPLDQFAR